MSVFFLLLPAYFAICLRQAAQYGRLVFSIFCASASLASLLRLRERTSVRPLAFELAALHLHQTIEKTNSSLRPAYFAICLRQAAQYGRLSELLPRRGAIRSGARLSACRYAALRGYVLGVCDTCEHTPRFFAMSR